MQLVCGKKSPLDVRQHVISLRSFGTLSYRDIGTNRKMKTWFVQ